MLKYFVVGAIALGISAVAYLTLVCPCERLPGLWLTGEEVNSPVEDWSFANEAALCQVEVSSWRVHSVNLNCMSSDNDLYVSCANCAGKAWSDMVLENPHGKIRIADRLYPVRFEQVVEPSDLDRAWRARETKLDRKVGERPEHWWSFRLSSDL